ncbi:MAG: hypothetical protein ACJ8HU_03885 [Chthoniobacterales bacterium]
MKTICITILAGFCFAAPLSHAQTRISDDARTLAKAWLGATCHEVGATQDDLATFAQHRAELRAYFLTAVFRQLEGDEMRDEEAALGRIYDDNLKRLNEDKPAWVTPEIEAQLRSISRDAYIRKAREALAVSYQQRALDGLAIINSLPTR